MAALLEDLREEWQERRRGQVLASIRKTHHTWARVRRVPGACIDKQLGHATHDDDLTDLWDALAGSQTGIKHYLDLESELIDPRDSALAVRELLDAAEVELRADDRSLLVAHCTGRTNPS